VLSADWQRFLKKTRVDGSCLIWDGGRFPTGYGAFWFRGGMKYAHRFCYEFHHGEIPEGMYVRHLCDNPPCVNLLHLEVGTPSQNHFDIPADKRRAIAVDAHAKRSPEERKAHAAKMRAARTPEGIRNGALKMTAARIARRRAQEI
jgi:hypothetical protein